MKISIDRFELPGDSGDSSDDSIFESIEFSINNQSYNRVYATKQVKVSEGQLLHFYKYVKHKNCFTSHNGVYRQTFENLGVDLNKECPNLNYDAYKMWCFTSVFRTTVIPTRLKYDDALPNISLPAVRRYVLMKY